MSTKRMRPACEDGPRDPRACAVRHRACSKLQADTLHSSHPAGLDFHLRQSNTELGNAQEKLEHLSATMKQASTEKGSHELLEQIAEEVECSVCLERPADTCFSPCGHCYCYHSDCGSSKLNHCPQCSKREEQNQTIWSCQIIRRGDAHGWKPDRGSRAVSAGASR